MLRTGLMTAMLLAAGPLAAEAPLPVEIVPVTRVSEAVTHSLYGTIEAAESYPASFRDGGRVTEIAVEVGDHLAAGELIGRVDDTQARAEAEAARAAVLAAEAALTQAQQARDRAQGLLDKGSGTQATLDEALQAFIAARAARDQAVTRRDKAEQTLDDTVLRAREAVIVTERSADPGEVLGAGDAVVTLAVEGRREGVFHAPDVASLASFVGRDATLSLLDGSAVLPARITEVSPVLGDDGTVELKAVLLDPGVAADLPIGSTVRGTVESRREEALSVPWTALTSTAQGPAVWVVDPDSNAVSLVQVEVLSFHDQTVELSGGVEPGQKVVGAGSHALYEGRVVAASEDLQ